MARCVNCGEDVTRPVWAEYADPAFENKRQDPFPLHGKCFTASETITATEWRPANEGPTQENPSGLELVEFDMTRYRKVDAPNG